ncbi:aminoacyltransferase, partial [Patescibacteria group bacterium]|nr:aminoacyltransferase [Patescibacteria group bacterium]
MIIKEITDKNVWEGFLLTQKEKTFLNSWNWGEFQKKQGEKIWRLGIYDKENLINVFLVIKVKARRGTFLFIPHGNVTGIAVLIKKLKEIAKEEKANFIRFAPICERTEENIKIFKDLGFREAPIHIHPDLTWELDIS